MLIDTHCHLNFQAFTNDLPQVLERARERGVTKFIIPGTDLASSERAVHIAQTYSDCWAAIGIHPHHAQDSTLNVNVELENRLTSLLTQNRVVAMGEIGLDYHTYRKSKYSEIEITDEIKQKQKELFIMQYKLAQQHNLSTILHCREAHDDMIQTISTISRNSLSSHDQNRENSSLPAGRHGRPPGVFHCWGGSKKHLQLLITMGYYIGFDGNITYSDDWGMFVRSTPLTQLLLETDSPYLTPQPHRGTRNEPMYIPLVADAVANYQGIPPAEVARITSANAQKLFGI